MSLRVLCAFAEADIEQTDPGLLEMLDEPMPTIAEMWREVSGDAAAERRADEQAERAAFFAQAAL